MADEKPHRAAPWAIRGVSLETRQAAAIACKQAGLPLGAWLDRIVRDAATDQIKDGGRQEVGPTQADMLAQIMARLDDMGKRLHQVEASAQPPEPHRLGAFGRMRVLLTGKP